MNEDDDMVRDREGGSPPDGGDWERWRGEIAANQEVVKQKIDTILMRMDTMIAECNRKHCKIDHRITVTEEVSRTMKDRMGTITRLMVGSVILIVGTAVAVALFLK